MVEKDNDLIKIDRNTILLQYFEYPVIQTFNDDVKDYIVDYVILKSIIETQNATFSDYSFILLPVCKAFEKHIYSVLLYVGFFSVGENLKRLGQKMSDRNKLKSFREYLKKHSILNTDEIARVLKNIEYMSETYNDLRNLPMHADGIKYSTFKKAELVGSSILKQINDFTTKMAKTGVNSLYNEFFGIRNEKMEKRNLNLMKKLKKDYKL